MYEQDEKDMSWGHVETSQQDNESEAEEKYTSWDHDDETMSGDDFIELQKRCVRLDVHDKKLININKKLILFYIFMSK